jgi:hypothetical protein
VSWKIEITSYGARSLHDNDGEQPSFLRYEKHMMILWSTLILSTFSLTAYIRGSHIPILTRLAILVGITNSLRNRQQLVGGSCLTATSQRSGAFDKTDIFVEANYKLEFVLVRTGPSAHLPFYGKLFLPYGKTVMSRFMGTT